MKFDKVDHFVYYVKNLDDAVKHYSTLMGAHITIGGKHTSKGTHNALLKIGNKSYLEFIALDPKSTVTPNQIWMGIDKNSNEENIRWAINTDNLEKVFQTISNMTSQTIGIEEGSRKTDAGTLRWHMISPLNVKKASIIPFAIDWTQSAYHPCERMTQQCSIKNISFHTDDLNTSEKLFSELNLQFKIIEGSEDKIELTLQCPNGTVVL